MWAVVSVCDCVAVGFYCGVGCVLGFIGYGAVVAFVVGYLV